MSRDDEYADWGPPVDRDEADDRGAEAEDADTPDTDETDLGPPSEMREPLFRDQVRDRFGLSPQQWYVVETVLLILPYPVFVAVYFAFEIDQTLFLMGTLAYSLVATYVGFLS